eukprot:364899-Chlamydomonas_euryale.AAC.16
MEKNPPPNSFKLPDRMKPIKRPKIRSAMEERALTMEWLFNIGGYCISVNNGVYRVETRDGSQIEKSVFSHTKLPVQPNLSSGAMLQS